MNQKTPGGPEIWIRGPVGAAAAPADISTASPQPFADNGITASAPPQEPSSFSWMSAHGGAGATTLATVFGGYDAGSRWPDPATGGPGRILLVARTHASGLQAVSHVLDMIRRDEQPPGTVLQAVVLVADAPGRLPPELAKRIKVIGSVVEIHRVPWVPAWRMGDLSGSAPRETSGLSKLLNSR
ncbi:MbcA/ParS/Xre antitoxin family protein [Streptomyces sp. NBC_00249]|uniref:DUF6668 family protein n=1 Tax=Streptomyces sp. NBC_00249 TaxID=2975690 RepID=UPI0022595584|nr:DUF6668 family protein [Streptomyces sp. NBC_00249]MCX5195007.1 MbcA/ParS/Xre antitoxin family protein [Streptomyces sp. NBC_00249]